MSYFPIFRTLEEAFAHYTECQLATLEMYETTKRMSNVRISRQREIAWGMVEECKGRNIQPPRVGAPRLRKLLENAP